jgi:hypothetical protein
MGVGPELGGIVKIVRATARLLVVLSVCTVVAGACVLVPPRPPRTTTTTTTHPPVAGDLLYEWSSNGGNCTGGECHSRITIARDGAWRYVNERRDVHGELDRATVDGFAAAIARDVYTLAYLPPARGCPPAIDAGLVVVRYHVDGRVTEVSNCVKDLFTRNPLLDLTSSVLQPIFEAAGGDPMALVRWTATGGRCDPLLCSQSVTIKADGSWSALRGSIDLANVPSRQGRLDEAATAELRQRVGAGLDSLATLAPSDGLCPSAYDGRDITYRLFVEGRGRRVSNCTRVIPGDNELLLYLRDIVTPIADSVPSPAT